MRAGRPLATQGMCMTDPSHHVILMAAVDRGPRSVSDERNYHLGAYTQFSLSLLGSEQRNRRHTRGPRCST